MYLRKSFLLILLGIITVSFNTYADHATTQISLNPSKFRLNNGDTKTFYLRDCGFGNDTRYIEKIVVTAKGDLWDHSVLNVWVNGQEIDSRTITGSLNQGLGPREYSIPINRVSSEILLKAEGNFVSVNSLFAVVSEGFVERPVYGPSITFVPQHHRSYRHSSPTHRPSYRQHCCDSWSKHNHPLPATDQCRSHWVTQRHPAYEKHCCDAWTTHEFPLSDTHKCYTYWANRGSSRPYSGVNQTDYFLPGLDTRGRYSLGRYHNPARNMADHAFQWAMSNRNFWATGEEITMFLEPIINSAGNLRAAAFRGPLSRVVRLYVIELRNSISFMLRNGYPNMSRPALFEDAVDITALWHEIDYQLDDPWDTESQTPIRISVPSRDPFGGANPATYFGALQQQFQTQIGLLGASSSVTVADINQLESDFAKGIARLRTMANTGGTTGSSSFEESMAALVSQVQSLETSIGSRFEALEQRVLDLEGK